MANGGQTMGRHKKPDKLTQENAQALAAGMSYGKWKALQPVAVEEKKPPKPIYNMRVCVICGLEYRGSENGKQKYCSKKCAREAVYRARRERGAT